MQRNYILNYKLIRIAGIFSLLFFTSLSALADLTPDAQAKVKAYQEKLATWSKDPDIIAAIKSMNQQSNNVNQEDWLKLENNDPLVEKYTASTAAKKLSDWQQDKNLGKLFIRDKNGNLAAGSVKPAIFNISDRPPFKQAISGKAWNSKNVKNDPTTKLPSIQLSHPVVSEGENIGIIHTAIILD